MRARPVSAAAAPALALVVLLAGCGSGVGASSSAVPTGSVAATRSSTGSATGASSTTASGGAGTTATGTTAAGSAGTGSAATATTSSAPAALAPTTGYATYELCQGTCHGSVPAALRRPLHLSSAAGGPCPVTINPDGPVSPSTSTQVGFQSITGSAWSAAEVTWKASGAYAGPILIRGGEVGGGTLGFGEGRSPYSELQLLDAGREAPRVSGGGRAWLTYTRLQSSGCYAYQVDGTSFSEVIVFRAIL